MLRVLFCSGPYKRRGFICLYTWHIACLGRTREVVSSAFTRDTSLVWVGQERCFYLPLHMTHSLFGYDKRGGFICLYTWHSLFGSDKRGGFICLYTWHIACLSLTREREVVSSAFTNDTACLGLTGEREVVSSAFTHDTACLGLTGEREVVSSAFTHDT